MKRFQRTECFGKRYVLFKVKEPSINIPKILTHQSNKSCIRRIFGFVNSKALQKRAFLHIYAM